MIKKNLIFPLAFIITVVISACGSGEPKAGSDTVQAQAPRELTDMTGVTSYYECPMKCEGKKFADAGVCPVCGMDLVLVEVKSDSSAAAEDTTNRM